MEKTMYWFILCTYLIISVLYFVIYKIKNKQFSTSTADENYLIKTKKLYRIIPYAHYGIFLSTLISLILTHKPLTTTVEWFEIVLIILPGLFFMLSIFTLGKQYSPCSEARAPTKLVTSGVYRYIRNPIYSSNICGTIAMLIICVINNNQWHEDVLVAILATSSFFLCLIVIEREEETLQQQFGEDYTQYKQNTGRFLPRAIEKIL
jgi:protein-S-isoprenylcysteine O-methyltransferase Ste14